MKLPNVFGAQPNLGKIARRYTWTASVVSVLALSISLLDGLGVSLLVPLLTTFTGDSAGIRSKGVLGLISRLAWGHTRNERLLVISAVILASIMLKAVFQMCTNTFTAWVDGRVGHDMRCALSERLTNVGYPFYLAQDPGRLFNILGTESWKASDAARVLMTRIATIVAIAVFSTFLLFVSWRLSLMVVAGGLVTRIVQKRMEARLRSLSKHTVAINQLLHNRMLFEVFGARVIRIFHTESAEQQNFTRSSDEVRRAILNSDRVSGTQGPLMEAMHGLLLVFVLLTAMFTGMQLPVLAAFLMLMNRIQPHLRILEGSAATFAAASAHFDEVEWLLDPTGRPSPPQGHLPFKGLRKEITFDRVTLDYGGRRGPALQEASFVLRRGHATALLGESGAGKSTVISLLCRLLDPTSGVIRVDGEDLAEIDVGGWLDSIALAGQDIELIDGTIALNIAYGRPETEPREIEEAIRAAHATFVQDLPLGSDTPVGPGGLSLSGGQRQRIGLARALVRKPALLILDEATNALDQETEESILRILEGLRGEITMLVVSHKPSSLAFCDEVVRLQGGKVLTVGPLASILPSALDETRSPANGQ
jgi:subfamily B ATP-binding cassette protein MsbA